ncbi:hypothetical protein [Rhodococcus sp. NPDC006774]|uniref:hypothetical protein n=1 Tax=Rhodococcus sp. NPDC006774 TaxID=3157186 RepID=UPI003403933F
MSNDNDRIGIERYRWTWRDTAEVLTFTIASCVKLSVSSAVLAVAAVLPLYVRFNDPALLISTAYLAPPVGFVIWGIRMLRLGQGGCGQRCG